MKKTVFSILAVALILVAALGCFVGCADPNTIKITEVTHSVFYAPLYIAIQNGYFEEEGYKVSLQNAGGSDKGMTTIIAGKADIGLLGPETAIYVYNEGKKDHPKIVAQLTRKDGSFLMARNASPNFSWGDLAGHEVISGRPGGMPAMALEYALKKNALMDKITLIDDVDFDNIAASFLGGNSDYCTMFEPVASNLEREGRAYRVASVGEEAGDMPFTAFIASQKFMQKSPEKLEAFMRALVKGMDFLHANTAEVVAKVLAPSFVGTDLDILISCVENYKRIGAYSVSPIMKEEDFELLQDVIIAAGHMSARASFADLVDNSIAEAVLAG